MESRFELLVPPGTPLWDGTPTEGDIYFTSHLDVTIEGENYRAEMRTSREFNDSMSPDSLKQYLRGNLKRHTLISLGMRLFNNNFGRADGS